MIKWYDIIEVTGINDMTKFSKGVLENVTVNSIASLLTEQFLKISISPRTRVYKKKKVESKR